MSPQWRYSQVVVEVGAATVAAFASRGRSQCRQPGGMMSLMIACAQHGDEASDNELKTILPMLHSNVWINLQISMFIDLFGKANRTFLQNITLWKITEIKNLWFYVL
ncbi:hypothetical protein AVEN_262123-1 [Araneus ventricosus]|uniref:Uncharacterized protein n=1 Tax=Araneus ventricosus TaxID=182803 RepID=A0A4Y2E769_ARAVE|nr:hypothetical protein AVEN_262123-1 [Araneus ventricosus]